MTIRKKKPTKKPKDLQAQFDALTKDFGYIREEIADLENRIDNLDGKVDDLETIDARLDDLEQGADSDDSDDIREHLEEIKSMLRKLLKRH